MYSLVFMFLLFLIWVKFLMNKSSILMSLLYLELIMLCIFMTFMIIVFSSNSIICMYFLTVSVSEAILGLGVLLSVSRSYSVELFSC